MASQNRFKIKKAVITGLNRYRHYTNSEHPFIKILMNFETFEDEVLWKIKILLWIHDMGLPVYCCAWLRHGTHLLYPASER